MSAKLHKSLGLGKLVVRNRTSGEVMLYFVTADGQTNNVCMHPLSDPLDLLKIADAASWHRGNLAQVVANRHVDVVL